MTTTFPSHGVLIQHHGVGVYLIGNSGVGKSEIALALIHQGAQLICDDAPEIKPDNNNGKLIGTCPDGFYGLMHIHDLGIINIIKLLGKKCFKSSYPIDFIIELVKTNNRSPEISHLTPVQILKTDYRFWNYPLSKEHCVTIPGISLHLYPDRNITLIINIALMKYLNHQ